MTTFTSINVPEYNLSLGFQGHVSVVYEGAIFVFGSGGSNEVSQCMYVIQEGALTASDVTKQPRPLCLLGRSEPACLKRARAAGVSPGAGQSNL
jgi:hypothetical protein